MTGPQIEPIDQNKLREHVYFALRDAFTRGEFAPGDVVNLRGLADQLGTSLTPVREAVRRLVAEGALVDTPSRTLMVPPFDLQRLEDLRSARIALEGLVLEKAIARADDTWLDRLDAIIAEPLNANPSGQDLRINYDFHFTLYRQSGSAVLLPVIEALWLQYGAYLNMVIREDTIIGMDLHADHRSIVEALRSGDSARAAAALQRDIQRSFEVLWPDDAPMPLNGGAAE